MNALVIGAGGFGKHHARILAQLDCEADSRIPRIKKLIVTRTQAKPAGKQAESIQNNPYCRVPEVIPAQVQSADHLREVLETHRPGFIVIAARDRTIGDTIHAVYTRQSLAYGAVLCEKPFCSATGSGESLRYFDALSSHSHASLFGLELPFAIVMRDMMKHTDIHHRLMHAKKISFYWETLSCPANYIINDLALHPWSVICDIFHIGKIEVAQNGNRVRIRLQLRHRQTNAPCECRIDLKDGGILRGMTVDGYAIGIFSDGAVIELVEMADPQKTLSGKKAGGLNRKTLLKIDNPLKQHLVAALGRTPIVNLKKAYRSQVFLEKLHGYMRA